MERSLQTYELLLSSQLSSLGGGNSYFRRSLGRLLWGRHLDGWSRISVWLSRVRLRFMSRSSIAYPVQPSPYQSWCLTLPDHHKQQAPSHPSAIRLVICSRSRLPKISSCWLTLSPTVFLNWLCWFGWLLLILPCFTCSSHTEMSSFLCKWWICERRPNVPAATTPSHKRPD